MGTKEWESVARVSVLVSLGFSAICMGIYGLQWLNTGQGSWGMLLKGSINIAGPLALIVFVLGAFPTSDAGRTDGNQHRPL